MYVRVKSLCIVSCSYNSEFAFNANYGTCDWRYAVMCCST